MVDLEQVSSRFRNSYRFALSSLAILLVVSELFSQYALSQQEKDAFTINLAGRQRMLSQRLTKNALLSETLGHNMEADITSDMESIRSAHRALQDYSSSVRTKQSLTSVATALDIFLETVDDFSKAGKHQGFQLLLAQESEFLVQMETLVNSFERDAVEKVIKQRRVQLILLMLLLGVILAQGYFVFRPLMKYLKETIVSLNNSEKESRKSLEKALESDQLKSAFLANVSHEIRTPLNGILGTVELFGEENDPDERADHLNIIRGSGDALLRIVNDILDLSKLESGQFHFREEHFLVSELLEDIVRQERAFAKKRGLQLILSIGAEARRWVVGDRVRLRQVLNNLIGNAIKFTPEGEVRASLSVDGQVLHFVVEDTGPGIPEDQVEVAISPFRQLDSGLTRANQGTGLGLAITSKLLELMGSKIEISSSAEGGARCFFRIEFPEGMPQSPPVPRSEKSNMDTSFHGKILLVEDVEVNQRVALKLLHKLGVQTRLADNGQEALDITKEEHFDLILMDLQMPVLDGLEATKKLRQYDVSTPIIALTANAGENDRAHCLACGMNDFLTKPIRRHALQEVFQRYLGQDSKN